MNLGLAGKRALIAGGSKGIGAAVVRYLAQEGVKTTILGRTRAEMVSLINSIPGESTDHSYLEIDMMESSVRREFCNSYLRDNNDYDIVVHCIGGVFETRDTDKGLDAWINEWIYNVGIAIEINSAILQDMFERKWGRIIHVSSISARLLRGSIPYCCSKSYLNSYITTMGRLYADSGVVISGVMPGAVEFQGSYWEKIKNDFPEKYYGYLREHQAIGRMGKPEEVASLVVYLASELSTFCTGVVMPVDGGAM